MRRRARKDLQVGDGRPEHQSSLRRLDLWRRRRAFRQFGLEVRGVVSHIRLLIDGLIERLVRLRVGTTVRRMTLYEAAAQDRFWSPGLDDD